MVALHEHSTPRLALLAQLQQEHLVLLSLANEDVGFFSCSGALIEGTTGAPAEKLPLHDSLQFPAVEGGVQFPITACNEAIILISKLRCALAQEV